MNSATVELLLPAALALLHFLWQGALLWLVAWLGLWLLRKRSPDVRYGFAAALLLAMAAAPAVTLAWLRAQGSPAELVVLQGPPPAMAAPGFGWTRLEGAVAGAMPWILGAYGAGVLLLSLRLVGSWAWLQAFRWRGARTASLEWQLAARVLSRRLGLSRRVRVLESHLAEVPMTLGVFRPVILVPTAALLGMEAAALEAVLAHELAHVRRLDYLVNLFQSMVETVLFYHPAVWWVSRQMRLERELCCDDQAVALCGDPLLYSHALARLEELRARLRKHPRLAAASHGGSLMNRIQRLLVPALAPMLPSRSSLLAGLATSLLAAAGLASAQETPPPPPPPPPAPEVRPVERDRVAVVVQDKDSRQRVSLRIKGKVDLKPDTPELARVEDGARLELSIREAGARRVLTISREDGKEVRTFTLDGKETALDPTSLEQLKQALGATKGKLDREALDRGGHERVQVYVRKGGAEGEAGKRKIYVYRSSEDLPDLQGLSPELAREVEAAVKEARRAAEEARKARKEGERAEAEVRRHAHRFRVPPRELDIELRDLPELDEVWESVPEEGELPPPPRAPRIHIRKHRISGDPHVDMADLKREMEALKARMDLLQKRLAEEGKGTPPKPAPTPKK